MSRTSTRPKLIESSTKPKWSLIQRVPTFKGKVGVAPAKVHCSHRIVCVHVYVVDASEYKQLIIVNNSTKMCCRYIPELNVNCKFPLTSVSCSIYPVTMTT